MNEEQVYTDKDGVVHGGEFDGMDYQDAANMYYKNKLDKYHEKEAKKGAKAVTDGTSAFTQDYVTPILRSAASLYGPTAYGLTIADTAQALEKGDYKGAAQEVAFEIASGFIPGRSKGLKIKKTPKWFKKTTGMAVRPTFHLKKSALGSAFGVAKEQYDQSQN